MSGLFVSQPHFTFQVWPDLKRNQDSAGLREELLHPLTRSCFLLLFLGRLSLLAFPHLLGTCLPSLWSPLFPLHATALIALSLTKVRLSLTLTLSHLVLWTDGSVPFPFGKRGSGVLANCSLCGTEATLSFSAGPVCSSFFAKACAILHAFYCSQQHQQIYSLLVLTLTTCFLRLSLYLNLFVISGRKCLLFPPVLSGYNGSPDTRFFQETTRLMSWPTPSATRAFCNPL